MKQPKELEEDREVGVEVDLEEGGMEEDDHDDFIIAMNKDT
jgi:hypothetical protein